MAYGTLTPGQLFQSASNNLEALFVDSFLAAAATVQTPVYAWFITSPKQLQITRLQLSAVDSQSNVKSGFGRIVVLQGQAGAIGAPLPFQLCPFNLTDNWDPMNAYGRKLLDLPIPFMSVSPDGTTLLLPTFLKSSALITPPGRGFTIAVQFTLTATTNTNPMYLGIGISGDCIEREEQLSGTQIPMDQSPEIKESMHPIERLVQ